MTMFRWLKQKGGGDVSGDAMVPPAAPARIAVDFPACVAREFGAEFIAAYLDAEWPAVSACVGVFRIEGPGVQLFERISGDQFTVLGMPLFPVLSALRERGVLLS